MPDSSEATNVSVRAAAGFLSGRRVTSVTYHGFSHPGGDWDHGSWHEATMGVELTTDTGNTFVACWGDAFGHFGLELFAAHAGNIFDNDPEHRDFTAHPWWLPSSRSPVSAELIWREGYVDRDDDRHDPAPVALLLSAEGHQVWIAAAEPCDRSSHMARGGFLLGTDGVLVTGDNGFAASVGLTASLD